MRSLRGRLGLVVGAVTFAILLVAGVLVARSDWGRDDAALFDDLAAQSAEVETRLLEQFLDERPLDVGDPPADGFVAAVDTDGDVVDVAGTIAADDLDEMVGITIDFDTGDDETLALDGLTTEDDRFVVATGCIEPEICEFLLVGRQQVDFGDYLIDRLALLVGVALAVAAASVAATRWVVGRSLRTVDEMRRELDEITSADLDRRIAVPASRDELEALGTSFNATIERLGKSVAAQRQFTSDAAHELRSPLAGMRATLEVAAGDPTRTSDAVDTAIGQVDRAARVVDDLLVLARHDSPAPRAEARPVDVDDVIRLQLREHAAGGGGVVVDGSGVDAVQTRAAPGSVERIVRNLLDNACAHAHSEVRIALRRDDATWMLLVDDDGPGVPEADRHRVFERFARLDGARARDTGGTGLGLAIVAGLVADLDGDVQVETSPLGGARFVVRAPVR